MTACVPHDRGREPADVPAGANGVTEVRGCSEEDALGFDALGPCPSRGDPAAPELATGDMPALRTGVITGTRAAVAYTLPAAGDILLAVYDISGRRMTVVESGFRSAGLHQAGWNASALVPGVYFYRLRANGVVVSRSVLILR